MSDSPRKSKHQNQILGALLESKIVLGNDDFSDEEGPPKSNKKKRTRNVSYRSNVTTITIPADAFTILLLLTEALYMYGSPAHSLEFYVDSLAQTFELDNINIRLSPTGFWIGQNKRNEYVNVSRSANMDRLSKVTTLVRMIIKGHKNIDNSDITTELKDIHKSKVVFKWYFHVLSTALFSGGFTGFFFGGNIYSVMFSLIIGFFAGFLHLIAVRKDRALWGNFTIMTVSFSSGLFLGSLVYFEVITQGCAFPAALGSTALYFPGTTIVFSVVEMLNGMLVVGAIRYVFALFMGSTIAVSISAGFIFWAKLAGDLVTDDDKIDMSKPCEDTSNIPSPVLAIIYYFFCYFAVLITYNVPPRLFLPFLFAQGLSFLVYFICEEYTTIGSAIASGVSVFVLVILSTFISHPYVKRFCHHMTPLVSIVPTLELLVPGSLVVKSQISSLLDFNNATTDASSYTTIALCLAVGLLFGNKFLKTVFPFLRGVFYVPTYKGTVNLIEGMNGIEDERLRDLTYLCRFLPPSCTQYIIFRVLRAENLIGSDWNGLSDPYVKVKRGKKTICRSTTKPDNLNPVWEETFLIPIESNQDILKVKVMDFDPISPDDPIGEFELEFITSPGSTENHRLCSVACSEKILISCECEYQPYTISGRLEGDTENTSDRDSGHFDPFTETGAPDSNDNVLDLQEWIKLDGVDSGRLLISITWKALSHEFTMSDDHQTMILTHSSVRDRRTSVIDMKYI